MKQILISILLLLTFSACEESRESQAQHDAQVAQEARAQLLEELKAQKRAKELEAEKNSKLYQIGIHKEEGKITIDLNKTENFFKEVGSQMTQKIERFSTDLQKGIMQEKDMGIEMNQTSLKIDLNKTKNFLEDFGTKMQKFVEDIDTMAEEIKKGY